MTDIVEFLRARLDEDEALAREACDRESGEWFMGDKWNVYQQKEVAPYEYSDTEELVVYGNMKEQSEHIARHDPARVLREVKAKRAIAAMHVMITKVSFDQDDEPVVSGGYCGFCQTSDGFPDGDWPCDTLKLLAAPDAEHADYDPAWRVE